MTLLRVVSTEQAVNCSIPSTFVTITPEHDTGMIHVTRQHFTDKTGTCRGIISILPASQLVDVEQTKGVAGIQEVFIGGIVRTNGVHVHLFNELDILYAEFFIRGSSAIGVEGVAIDAFHYELGTV